MDILMLGPIQEADAHSYPAYVDQDGNEWAVNRVVTDEAENDACERCGADIKDKAFSLFMWDCAELRCSDCVRFVDGARPPAMEDR